MKLLPLFLLTLTLLSGCEKETDSEAVISPPSEDVMEQDNPQESQKREEIAEFLADSLQSGEFQAVITYFDGTLNAVLDENALEGAWFSTVSPLGAYLGERSMRVEGQSVLITERYEVQNLLITLVFGESNLLSGINLSYTNESPTATTSPYFKEEEMIIATEEHLPLGGFLTLPEEVETPPVVLLVQGSGPNDRNSSIYQNVPLLDIAHGLAEKGIASLRYDKRFFTYPEEGEKLGLSLTLEAEILEDVSTALKILENDPRLGDIYVLGHSLGGMLTPSIATTHPVVQGIISVGGSPQPLYEISYAQNKESEAFQLEHSTDPDILDLIKRQMEQVEEDILTLRGDFSHLSEETILIGFPAVYQQSVKNHAGENFLDDLDIPMLILQGGEDFQVSPTVDFALYQEILGDRDNVTFHFYEGLNHLMMDSEIRDVSDYQEKKVVDPNVIEDIANFINEQSENN